MNFSVLTSLYKSNTPVEVRDCFRSISLQTILPTEVVVIIDGPISQDLINEINFWEDKVNIVKHIFFRRFLKDYPNFDKTFVVCYFILYFKYIV